MTKEDVKVGQKFLDCDARMGGRTVAVREIVTCAKSKGRFKAGEKYARCVTSAGVKVSINVARLAVGPYTLVDPGQPDADAARAKVGAEALAD